MKQFLDDNFLLESESACRLYHDFAKSMPIIDYHSHLSVAQIASDHQFENLTQAWLHGDHYKWRAMRANGIDESYCTGDKRDVDKFEKWSETVPFLLRNPLYHWTHLELRRYFHESTLLSPSTAKRVYYDCSDKLKTPEFSTRNLLKKMNVEALCTTDDPIDDLVHHKALANEFEITVLPAFRPDRCLMLEDAIAFNAYLSQLEKASDIAIISYQDFLSAIKQRHDFFALQNCSVADHGISQFCMDDYTLPELKRAFDKIRANQLLNPCEIRKLKSGLLIELATWNYEKNWVQQFHIGALRNSNSRKRKVLGADTGFDSIDDFRHGYALSKFLDRLDQNDQLTKTILYNLNPCDNELFATIAGNFNEGPVKGKVQFGAAWWFSDQKDGITRQLNTLSNMGLVSNFVGMLTDSRSFLSFPRHEYFRRILCNLFGTEIEKGELPDDLEWTGKVIQDICYYNSAHYFNWENNAINSII